MPRTSRRAIIAQSKRARTGEVRNLIPTTQTRESQGAFSRRMGRRRSAEQFQSRSRVRSVAVIVAIVAALAAASVGVGVLVYHAMSDTSTQLQDEQILEALGTASQTKGQAGQDGSFYVLVTFELGAISAPLDNDGPDMLELIRVNPADKKLCIVGVPAQSRVTLTDGQTHELRDAAAINDAALIKAVENLTQVKISHYAKVSQAGLTEMLDTLGGIDITLDQVVDDPRAGNLYIPKGDCTLDATSAFVYLRNTNLKLGVKDQLANQVQFTALLWQKLFSSGGALGQAVQLDKVSGAFETDASSRDLVSFGSSMSNISFDDMYLTYLPGYQNEASDVVEGNPEYYVVNTQDWQLMLESMEAGGNPDEPLIGETGEGVDPQSFTITVQNGAGIAGAAGATRDVLVSKGFKVEETGNADQQIYTETLVVYDNDDGLAQAMATINAIGLGRPVYGMGYYEYETDVLVVIGSDYEQLH